MSLFEKYIFIDFSDLLFAFFKICLNPEMKVLVRDILNPDRLIYLEINNKRRISII